MLIIPAQVITGALVNAIALVGRKIGATLADLYTTDDLTTARWFETFRLTDTVPGQPDLSPAAKDELLRILNGDEIQAALQELLAARLTDAPEIDATRARNAIRLTLGNAAPDAARFAEGLAAYYDDQICALVAHLQADDSSLLAQIRSDAFSTRMINILHAIERHTAALMDRPEYRTEMSFLANYRNHVVDQHGKLEPPDFERRRRIPLASIYVPATITPTRQSSVSPLNVLELAKRIDRFVLLGDPGGGKTTATNVLMHHFASDVTARAPFLVTLRDFAAQDPPERSVVGHIEYTLETLYQCPSPPGLVNYLLLTARAIVIFDGLDELLDTSRRADVTTRVERFCAEYPLVPVLVTSRLIGYNQARLDDSQFFCYFLDGFGDKQVEEYAHKWFAQDAGARRGDAQAFLTESASVPDLRSNPLLLALLCILYRGAGSLPRNRAEVYEQCSTLLFRKWDARRRIHQDLRAGHLLEPALRHLAWWLFTRDTSSQSVTERGLIATTTKFLHGRGFESKDDARDAAREFVEFCRGRMWVFSDAGTTATGEKLYAFTHRTFLEYFAAAQIAYDCDTPELLVHSLAPHVAQNEWWVLAELAIQIKDRTTNDGAPRIYAAMLDDLSRQSTENQANVLQFLIQCLRSVDPSPALVRKLTEKILAVKNEKLLEVLVSHCGTYIGVVVDQIDTNATDIFRLSDKKALAKKVKYILSVLMVVRTCNRSNGRLDDSWLESKIDRFMQTHAASVVQAAQTDSYVRNIALGRRLITIKQALDMPDGLSMLFDCPNSFFASYGKLPYLESIHNYLLMGWPTYCDSDTTADLKAIGQHICNYRELPWISAPIDWRPIHRNDEVQEKPLVESESFDSIAYLGAAAILSILIENERDVILDYDSHQFGPLAHLFPYFELRKTGSSVIPLPELPIPDQFRQTFRDWAEGRVDFTAGRHGRVHRRQQERLK